jgi:2,4-dienoyl-CoA reductase-like NADH-dependent reductase (Old Yellow Enzyme family)
MTILCIELGKSKKMKNLFDKTKIKNIELKNRFIRSATHEAMASADGNITDKLLQIYEDLAKGGVGLIITGFSYTISGESPSPKMLAAYDDSFIEGFKTLTDTVHKYDSKIIMQFAYGGSITRLNAKNRVIWGPSAVEHLYTKITPVEMTVENIKTLIEAFGDAALRAKKGGFDGVQIHAAHGYMLNQFLSPYYNRRNDEYGGNTENRAKIIFEIYENIRKKTGEDFIISIKINCQDFMENDGLQFEETKYICKKLDEMGIDLIEISGNVGYNQAPPVIFETGISKDTSKQSYFSKYAAEIAKTVKAPVSVVGGNRNFELMTEILNNTNISYFSLSRTLLSEPDLINKWQKDNNYKPKCLACNKCWSLKGNICILNRAKT